VLYGSAIIDTTERLMHVRWTDASERELAVRHRSATTESLLYRSDQKPDRRRRMKRLIYACTMTVACAFAVSVSAQDTTVKSKTKVKADDARTVTMKGCLQQGTDADTFTLAGSIVTLGEDLKSKSKVKTDVDDDETEVRTRTKTEVQNPDEAVGTAGAVTTYELMPKEGVNLTPHVGHTVEVTALMLDPKSGTDDDAEVEMRTKSKIKVDDAPDTKVKSKTKAELPRGDLGRLTAISVKHVSPTCTM
jgi:hypothetical protein